MTRPASPAVARVAPRLACLLVALPTAAAADEPPLRDFMGINGHTVLFRPELYAPAATHVRDYHNFEWDVDIDEDGTGGDTRFPYNHDRWINWDTMYGDWVDEGYRINPAIQFSIEPGEWSDLAADARKYGEAFAEHFGATHGNGLVASVQVGNEMVGYSDSEYRTLFRNMAEGIRATDPNLPIVTAAATAGPSTTYSKSLTSVFTGLDHLYDVIAVHSYPHLTGWPTWEPSYPEDPRLPYLRQVQDVINWRNQNAPTKQVWVTEFGYDATTKQPNPNSEFRDWIDVTDTQQAQYLTRSFLLFAGMDLDRAYMYWANDTDNPQLHGSSGLTRNYDPKPSYWAISHLQATLGDYRFDSIVEQEEGHLYIYAFVHETDPEKLIWVLWSPTGSGRETLVTLDDVVGGVIGAERMPLTDGGAPSVPWTVLADGRIQLAVGESPTYLFLHAPEPASAAVLIGAAGLAATRRRLS